MKKNQNTVIALVLAICLLAGPGGAMCAQASTEFTDMPFGTYFYYIDYLNQALSLGFFTGTSSTTFSPEQLLTRGQAVTVLGRVHEKLTGETIQEPDQAQFLDVAGYSSPYVNWAWKNHIIGGYGDGSFRPNNPVTNGELACVFNRYLNLIGRQGLYEGRAYDNQIEIPKWTKESVTAISGYEIFTGGAFHWGEKVSRAEAVRLFVRMYEKAAYPVDRETPRQKFSFRRDDWLGDEAYEEDPDSLHSEYHILNNYEEYTQFMGEISNVSQEFSKEEQPVALQVDKAVFQGQKLVAVVVQAEGAPCLDMELGSWQVMDGTLSATVTCSGAAGSVGGVMGNVIVFPVPEEAVRYEALKVLLWTEDFFGPG